MGTGGAEKLMVDLLPRLAADGHDVELAVFDGQRTPFYDQLLGRGIKVHSLGQGSVYSPRHILSLRKLIKHGHYDIVHTHNTACQLYGALACVGLKNVRLFTTEHNTTNRRRGHWYWRPIDRWMYSRYERVICISQDALNCLNDYKINKSENNIIIENGIDVAAFEHPIKDIASSDKYHITMIAAFREQKNQDTLIHAISLLPNNYRCRLVGDGVRRNVCETLAHELGVQDRVEFTGARSDIPDLLGQSDINVLSSHYEGLSLSSLEAMSSGRPFIASDVPGLHDIVDGVGILVPDNDARALADAIINLTTNSTLYTQVSQACHDRASKYDISKMVDGYLKIYINC